MTLDPRSEAEVDLARLLDVVTSPTLRNAILTNSSLMKSIAKGPGKRTSNSHSHRKSSSHTRRKTEDEPNILAKLLADEERQAEELRAVLRLAEEKLDEEAKRADEAEQKVRRVDTQVATLVAARQHAESEAARANETLKWYRLQLENAQKEIIRAQDEINALDEERNQAEEEALQSRSTARKLLEEMKTRDALEQGRAEGRARGIKEGMNMARAEGIARSEEREAGRDALHQVLAAIVADGVPARSAPHQRESSSGPDTRPSSVPTSARSSLPAKRSQRESASGSDSDKARSAAPPKQQQPPVAPKPAPKPKPGPAPHEATSSSHFAAAMHGPSIPVADIPPKRPPSPKTPSEERRQPTVARSERSTPTEKLEILQSPELPKRLGELGRSELSVILEGSNTGSPSPQVAASYHLAHSNSATPAAAASYFPLQPSAMPHPITMPVPEPAPAPPIAPRGGVVIPPPPNTKSPRHHPPVMVRTDSSSSEDRVAPLLRPRHRPNFPPQPEQIRTHSPALSDQNEGQVIPDSLINPVFTQRHVRSFSESSVPDIIIQPPSRPSSNSSSLSIATSKHLLTPEMAKMMPLPSPPTRGRPLATVVEPPSSTQIAWSDPRATGPRGSQPGMSLSLDPYNDPNGLLSRRTPRSGKGKSLPQAPESESESTSSSSSGSATTYPINSPARAAPPPLVFPSNPMPAPPMMIPTGGPVPLSLTSQELAEITKTPHRTPGKGVGSPTLYQAAPVPSHIRYPAPPRSVTSTGVGPSRIPLPPTIMDTGVPGTGGPILVQLPAPPTTAPSIAPLPPATTVGNTPERGSTPKPTPPPIFSGFVEPAADPEPFVPGHIMPPPKANNATKLGRPKKGKRK